MALPVLDGNQSATTLSSVVTGGEHIVAHTVVSLGSTAISNISTAVSGVNNAVGTDGGTPTSTKFIKIGGHQDGQNQVEHIVHVSAGGAMKVDASGSSVTFGLASVTFSAVSISNFPASQTINGAVNASVTNLAELRDDAVYAGILAFQDNEGGFDIASLPAISGTVTANGGDFAKIPAIETSPPAKAIRIGFGTDENWNGVGLGASGVPLPVAIFDAAGVGDGISFTQIGGKYYANVNVGNSITIGSLPRVTFIDGSGTVVTANSAVTLFASSTTRSYLLVQVTTGSAFVNVGATATTVNGINLTAGQGYAWETTIPQGLVSLISTTTSSRWVAKEA